MFGIKPDDLFNKTDQLLFCILQELKQLNKPLRPIARDTVAKRKPKPKNAKAKQAKPVDNKIVEVQK